MRVKWLKVNNSKSFFCKMTSWLIAPQFWYNTREQQLRCNSNIAKYIVLNISGEVKSTFFSECICYHSKSYEWLSHPQKSSLQMVGVALALGYYARFKVTHFLEPPTVTKIGTLWNLLMLYITGKEIQWWLIFTKEVCL